MSDDLEIAVERIDHMIEATTKVAAYVSRGRAMYDTDSVLRDAILYQIVVLGEAAKAVARRAPQLAAEVPGVEWSAIAKMRDRITHQYWALDDDIVWNTAVEDVPLIQQRLSDARRRLGT